MSVNPWRDSEARKARFRKVPGLSFTSHFITERYMETKEEIDKEIKSVIRSDLWTKYNNLSYREMAKAPVLETWSTQLLKADLRSSDADE